MRERLDAASIDTLFRQARTHRAWQPEPLPEALLRELYALASLGPTSANCSPLRLVFVTSAEGKERLRPCLARGNVEKTMSAPATAILAYDRDFTEKLPFLNPSADAGKIFGGTAVAQEEAAFRNATLQGGYFILAARALGLDCGPMSGFDRDLVDEAFFPERRLRSDILVNLGVGDESQLRPRLPRLPFDQVCRFA